jgi:hypothetical protein
MKRQTLLASWEFAAVSSLASSQGLRVFSRVAFPPFTTARS